MQSNDLSDIDIAVATLLLIAGELMENASVNAATIVPTYRQKRLATTNSIRDADRDIAVLTAAAYILASIDPPVNPSAASTVI